MPRRGPFFRAVWLAALVPLAFAACGEGEYDEEEAAPAATASAESTSTAPAANAATPKPLPPSAFKVEWVKADLPPTLPAGKSTPVRVTFRNTGDQVWPDNATADPRGDGSNAIRLSYRWLPAKETMGDGYAARVDLPKPLAPGEEITVTVEVEAPKQPWDHRLQFDLVQELVSWFEGQGATPFIVPAKVV